MDKKSRFPEFARRMAISCFLGLGIAGVAVVVEMLVEGHRFFALESVDSIFTAVLTSLVVFTYEQRRYIATVRKLRMIAAMNRHVRDALQVIVNSRAHPEQEAQMKAIKTAVAKIDWALKEVLPGEAEMKKAA